ncbi:MAG: ABC transporter ATP-binding protein [Bacteroidales bacterium]|nr:ABC transporter ATP-binding protein [Bacteroidales bacterium]
MSTAIKIENVSKQYRLGVISTGTLSHDLNRWWTTKILRKEDPYLKIGSVNDRSQKADSEYVWALKDINMEIEQGDVVGIIGKNGAGKSTLLKLLSRVTKPTTGSIKYKGRIASLLEVGTGFHPEMTGRENIYMNGAIMGMTKQEITRKLDEIVDFSGCERYIDTPVKRYSSGMTVRLGFAIAAHLEPEILVVDEVLAVGDAEFQKKAIGKMQDVSKGGGRTVLFVSHNMAAVKSLCKNGVILQNGMLVDSGDVDTIVSHYLKGDGNIENHKIWNVPEVKKGGFELLEIGVRKVGGDYGDVMRVDQNVELVVRYRLTEFFKSFHLTFHFKNEQGYKIFSTSGAGRCVPFEHKEGEYIQVCTIPANYLNWGSYMVDMFLVRDKSRAFYVDYDAVSFTLSNRQAALGSWMGREPGDVTPKFDYKEELVNG